MQLNIKSLYPVLLCAMMVASYFHIQGIVVGIAALMIILQAYKHFGAARYIRMFLLLLVPVFFGLIAGYANSNYLIAKDAYYLSIPVIFILCGIMLAASMEIPQFLRAIVFAGSVISLLVTGISVSYVGLSTLTDPYSAHYIIGIVGTPGPPLALGCLLLSHKFNIKLFSRMWFSMLVGLNLFGVYMFASRTYFIVTLCFLFLWGAHLIKRKWLVLAAAVCVCLFLLMPSDSLKLDSSGTFVNKIMSSFSEVSIGAYNTEQDMNIRYRGYESFMALNTYAGGGTKDWVFGGLGKLVDLKTFIRLGADSYFRFIPVLHNGWLYILLKTGALGVLTYLIVFIRLIVVNWRRYANKTEKPIIRLFASLTIGCVLGLLLTNYVVNAFFNIEMSTTLITLGYSYYQFNYLQNLLKERQHAEQFEVIPGPNLTYSL